MGSAREGKARLHVDGEHFYNPKQMLQRDLSVLALQQHAAQSGSRSLTLLDALCGGGVRAIRYLLEVDHVSAVVANDVDARATRATAVNVELSLGHELRSQFEISQRPAAALMMERPRRFDCVELDPCGSVSEYLLPAMRCLSNGGLLLASCTDLGTMSGRFGDACSMRYGSVPLASAAKQAPELALRMLLHLVMRTAGTLGRHAEPLLGVVFADFFVRVIVRVRDDDDGVKEMADEADGADGADEADGAGGADEAKDAAPEATPARSSIGSCSGLLVRCCGCGTLHGQLLGGEQRVGTRCEHCGSSHLESGGPIYLGASSDAGFVKALLARLDAPSAGAAAFGSHAVLRPLLQALLAEAMAPRASCVVHLPTCSRWLHSAPAPPEFLLRGLGAAGHAAVVAHWEPMVIKTTDAGASAAWDWLAAWAKKNPLDARDGARDSARGEGAGAGESAGEGGGEAFAGREADETDGTPAGLLRRRRPLDPLTAEAVRGASTLLEQKQKRRKLASQAAAREMEPLAPVLPGTAPALAPAASELEAPAGVCFVPSLTPAGLLAPPGTAPARAAGSATRGSATRSCHSGGDCPFPFAHDRRADATPHGCIEVLGPPGGGSGAATSRTYTSLAEAVAQAKEGSVLLIGRGEYEVSSAILINRPLALCAARGARLLVRGHSSALVLDWQPQPGERGAVAAIGEAMALTKPAITLDGLEIVQTRARDGPCAQSPAEAAAEAATCEATGTAGSLAQAPAANVEADASAAAARGGYALVVRGAARCMIRHCTISSEVTGGVFVSAGAAAELHSCHVHRTAAHGVLVSGRACVTLSHCHVESSQAAGVEVRGRATVLLHCCRVHRSLRSGVFVTAFGELHIEWSNLFGNAFAALECAGEAEAHVLSCRIHHGQRGGVMALGRARLTMRDCTVDKNSMAGVSVRGTASAALVGNTVTNGRASGVYVSESASAEVSDNLIRGNQLCGLELDGAGATLVARRNKLGGNLDAMSVPAEGGRMRGCVFEDNVVSG